MRSRRSIIKLLLCAPILLTPNLAQASDYPERPIRLIVPFPPGGGTDVMARLVGQYLGQQLGQSVIIDNRGGAGGNIAMHAAATSSPDGYTLFFATTGTMTVNPALYKDKMQVKPLVDFEPIGTAVLSSHVVIVNKDLPVANITDLIALAKQRPGALTFGSSGNGGVVHLTGELFKRTSQIDILHVPYRGSAPALTDLMGGRISMMFDITPGDLPYITSGDVKALAVTTANRIPALPDVPTVSEAGLPGFVSTSWFGIVVPKGTSPEIKNRLASALAAALSSDDLKKRLVSLGAEAFHTTPDEFNKLLQADTAKWSTLVESSGATIE
ncbi:MULTISPECIES: tripartite tricarboxylate transporter substrate binding protein [unclassified Bradyrhizobium]|uniref:Bug family tripartite tricarboxylate transporter substrate binding protein n=1 Tax=unclassified Bradyrhizobium TaxID=2631580 RepID=UPI001FFAA09C|nr:tripartite tricarboxylate transporter substrate binding protein [Bradyrhizobium sp. 48]MCK1446676.1 tripartite tricarboxylate transporter substrate binding protein [Bradyrhizobium sp. 48]